MLDVGIAAHRLRDDADTILLDWHRSPLQAAVRLWDMLWRLAKTPALDGIAGTAAHPVVRQAMGMIEQGLDGTLSVAAIAVACQISHNQLTRLFKQELDCTPVRWIRRRRMEQAAYLLRDSDLPVKDIARQVGLSDLQQFNRCVHVEWGCSPRALRERTGPADRP